MASAYLLWENVTLTEEVEEIYRGDGVAIPVGAQWVAVHDGPLYDPTLGAVGTVPSISFYRSGPTPSAAKDDLLVSAQRYGWDIR